MRTITLTDLQWAKLMELMEKPIYRQETPDLEALRKGVYTACQVATRRNSYHDD